MDLVDYSDWLSKNAGPIIRFRTATEFLHKEKEVKLAKKSLLSSDLVKYWLGNLKPAVGRNELHGAKTETYENAMGKLYEFGFKKGMPILDHKTEPFRLWLRQQINAPIEGYLPVFFRTLVAAFLAMTGYANDESVRAWVLKRLETIYPFAKKGDLSKLYVPQNTYPGFPKAFRNAPLINPEIYQNEEMQLPWIHDMNAFLHSPSIMEDATLRAKVETIIKFILSPEYQRLPLGYGIVRHAGGRYYVMGWSVHLPRYFGSEVSGREFGRILLLLDLLGRSNTARKHGWFKQSVEALTHFKNEEGLISFPRKFLPEEKRIGVWVLGMRMGLEENRRMKKAITCESTFRFLKIISQML
ncbi:MAG TPA: hypothetical protein VMS95_02875 [Candidatus Krumholzibacteriaceae bacterium]|nr:hypothetical protein [Candidatus Krumholzibacteriaceae bacterium]